MNRLWKVLVFLVLGFCLFGRLAAGEPASVLAPETVGQRGDLDQLVLEGNTTFSSSAIQATLTWDFDVLIAGHPAVPWTTFLGIIQRKIETGYRASGFAEVRVDVHPNALKGKLLVHIDEGPRYLAGGVNVKGAHTLSAELLTERLTKPYWPKEALESGKTDVRSKMEDPVWQVGKPAYFPSASAKVAADTLPGSGTHFAQSSANASSAWRFPQTPVSTYDASNIGCPTYSTSTDPYALSETAKSLDTPSFRTRPLYSPHLNENLSYSVSADHRLPSEKARPQYTADINVGPLYTPSFNDRLSYGSFATASHGQGDTHPYGTSASASYHGATSNPYAQDPLENPILGSNRYTPVRKDNWYGPSGSAPKLSPLESQVADALADLGDFFRASSWTSFPTRDERPRNSPSRFSTRDRRGDRRDRHERQQDQLAGRNRQLSESSSRRPLQSQNSLRDEAAAPRLRAVFRRGHQALGDELQPPAYVDRR